MAERPGKKQLKALRRAREEAARAYREQRGGTEGRQRGVTQAPPQPSVSPEPVAVEHFLQAYGELTNATVELYRRLAPEDPRHDQVREALSQARRAASLALDGTEAEPEAEPEAAIDGELYGDAADYYLASSGSVELVRTARPEPPPLDLSSSQNLPAVVRRPQRAWLPSESFVARYARVRRATHRWPDEAVLTRYLRDRQLPDESSLRRYLRRRRELYQRYG